MVTSLADEDDSEKHNYLNSIHELTKFLENSSGLGVFLLFGIHGSEYAGSCHVAQILETLITKISPAATIRAVGPVSPWACRQGFRFDRVLSDPNRIFCQHDQAELESQLITYWNLWQLMRPITRSEILEFLYEAKLQRLDIEAMFQMAQTIYPGIPGYVHYKSQQRRLMYLVNHCKALVKSLNLRKILFIDVHTGVGLDGYTHVYFHRTSSLPCSHYLVDHLAAIVQNLCCITCIPIITETGVVNNLAGMIDCLRELSCRSFHKTCLHPERMQKYDTSWIQKTKLFLHEAFDIKVQ